MTEICLVRHGETDWNARHLIQGSTDIPLNEQGWRQAEVVAEYLAQDHWDWLYSSPLQRAYDTATVIGERLGCSRITTDSRFKERDFGEAEGMEVGKRASFYHRTPIPGAETREEVQTRGMAGLEQIAISHPESRVLVISHGGLIAGLLALLSGGKIVPGDPPLKNTCMNLLRHENGEWNIEWYNRTAPELEEIASGR